MYKKYLGKTKIGDTRKVEEFTVIAVKEYLCIVEKNKKNKKALKIPYEDLKYPQFIDINNIDEEIKNKIKDFFNLNDELILVNFSTTEEKMVTKIIDENKREFDI